MSRPRPRRRVPSVLVLLALWCSAGAVACNGAEGSGPGGKGAGREGKKGAGPGGGRGGPADAQALQVNVVRLTTAPIERWYQSSGTLEAIRSAELVAVQPAIIEKVLVDEGDPVQEGQLLARLDGRALSLQADAARVELQNLEAELRRLESVSSAAISREEIDKQRYLVEQARASVRVSRHQAKQTVVRAPFSGTIVTRYVDEGNFASTSTPLFHLADLRVLELPLYLPEKDAATVAVGSDVEIELVDGTTFTARIERRAPVVDPLTGTVKLTVRTRKALAAEGGKAVEPAMPPGAAPGAFARAKVLVDRREAVPSLPRQAVFQLEGKPHVFVVAQAEGSGGGGDRHEGPGGAGSRRGGSAWKAQRREVKLGLEGADRVEIVAGLGPDEPVVAEGNAGITEGMPLTPVEAEAEAEVAAAKTPTAAQGS
jgi:membrane fusion protein, multidrug efflux system